MLVGELNSYEMEKRYFHKNGEIVWVLLSVSLVRNEKNEAEFFISQIQNITEKKTAKEELSLIFENSPDVIARINNSLRCSFINPVIETLTGNPPQYFIGKNSFDIGQKKSDRLRFTASILNVFKTGTEEKLEFSFPTLKGDRFFNSVLIPEFGENGKIESVLIYARDITKRRKLEAKIAERERELDSILRGTPTIIARMTRDYRHIYINDAVEIETGLAAELFIGKTLAEIGIPVLLSDKVENAIASVFKTKESKEFEFSYTTPFGLKYYLGRFTPEFDSFGDVTTVLIFTLDITKRKQAELKLIEALEQVKQLQGMLPICSYCKNIRDDQDYWHTLESYMATHSEAKFSHGICPSCYSEKVLPELEEFKRKKIK